MVQHLTPNIQQMTGVVGRQKAVGITALLALKEVGASREEESLA